MGINSIKKKIPEMIKKYKYVAIILVIGVVLMLIPNTSGTKTVEQTNVQPQTSYVNTLDQDLISLLNKVEGAGRVEVMLTVSTGEQTVYQIDTDQSSSDQATNIRNTAVILSDSSRNEHGMIIRIDPPKYRGALVLCQGADNPAVRLAVIEAVGKVTGLGADRICVLKMK